MLLLKSTGVRSWQSTLLQRPTLQCFASYIKSHQTKDTVANFTFLPSIFHIRLLSYSAGYLNSGVICVSLGNSHKRSCSYVKHILIFYFPSFQYFRLFSQALCYYFDFELLDGFCISKKVIMIHPCNAILHRAYQ